MIEGFKNRKEQTEERISEFTHRLFKNTQRKKKKE
jgi:hypothetical protein